MPAGAPFAPGLQLKTVRELSLDLFGFEPGIAMTDLHRKLSAWAKLYKRWDARLPRADFDDGAPRASERPMMCAMEVELRAMEAKADTSLDDAMAALKSSSRPRS